MKPSGADDGTVALPMYLGIGFVKAYDAPPIFGMAYAVYTKAL